MIWSMNKIHFIRLSYIRKCFLSVKTKTKSSKMQKFYINRKRKTILPLDIFFFRLLTPKFRGKIRHHGRKKWMGKDSALYQLMIVRMDGAMNGIVCGDGEYNRLPDTHIYSYSSKYTIHAKHKNWANFLSPQMPSPAPSAITSVCKTHCTTCFIPYTSLLSP